MLYHTQLRISCFTVVRKLKGSTSSKGVCPTHHCCLWAQLQQNTKAFSPAQFQSDQPQAGERRGHPNKAQKSKGSDVTMLRVAILTTERQCPYSKQYQRTCKQVP